MAIPRSELLAQIDSLKRSLATGATTVVFEGRTVSFRNVSEILEIIRRLEADAGLYKGPRTWKVAHYSGVFPKGRDQ